MTAHLSLGIVTGSMSRNAGGLFNSVRKSALYLADSDVRVSVFALRDAHSDSDLAEWAPLKPELFASLIPGPLPYSPKLARRLHAADLDVLHLHGIWQLQSRAVSRWKRKTGRPVMISPRGMLDPWALANSAWKKKLIGAWFEDRNLREADCLHALSRSEADSFRAYGLTNPIAVIPNAIDLPETAPRMPSTGRKTLLFLGRIHPKKGLKELIAAWGTAHSALAQEWQLKIAGWDDGGHMDGLRRQIADLGLGGSVSLVGPAFGEHKDRLLREAAAFVLPSFSEGLPMSVLEAWAHGLPVLMTQHCNLPEGFAAGAALKIDTEPEKLAAGLIEGLRLSDLNTIGEAGRSLVEDRFVWPKIAAQHLKVYRWMIGDGECPACVER